MRLDVFFGKGTTSVVPPKTFHPGTHPGECNWFHDNVGSDAPSKLGGANQPKGPGEKEPIC